MPPRNWLETGLAGPTLQALHQNLFLRKPFSRRSLRGREPRNSSFLGRASREGREAGPGSSQLGPSLSRSAPPPALSIHLCWPPGMQTDSH